MADDVIQEAEEKQEVIEEPTPASEGEDQVDEDDALKNAKNPERTKKYIESLKEKIYKKEESPQIPDANQYSHLTQDQINQIYQSMSDENGYLDANKFASYLDQTNKRVSMAQETAQRAQQTIEQINNSLRDQQEKEAQKKVYAKYPQLNPEDEGFDPKMARAVFNELAVKAKSGEYPTDKDYLESADRVYNDFYKDQDMKKEDKVKLEEANNQKIQSSSVRPRSSTMHGYFDGQEEERLREQVRQGKRGALAELLRRKEQSNQR